MSETQDAESGEVLADEPVYVISVAAKLAALPSWTLRVLDKQGIVSPKRTEKDRRLYSDRDIARLARVRYLTEECGVNINGVKVILEMEERGMRAGSHPQQDGGEIV
jgi:MerR family transcriptional regulator/heat shock protein HspR